MCRTTRGFWELHSHLYCKYRRNLFCAKSINLSGRLSGCSSCQLLNTCRVKRSHERTFRQQERTPQRPRTIPTDGETAEEQSNSVPVNPWYLLPTLVVKKTSSQKKEVTYLKCSSNIFHSGNSAPR